MNRLLHAIAIAKVRAIFAVLFFVILSVCVTGCASGVHFEQSDKIAGPGIEEVLPHGTQSQLVGDPLRLKDEIRRAIKACLWGQLSIDTSPSPVILPPPAEPMHVPPKAKIIRASALTVHNQNITILAWPVTPKSVGIAVKVGYFGDQQQQEKFISHFTELMQGKPGRNSNRAFTLPERE